MAQLQAYPVDSAPATAVLVVEDETMIRLATAEDLRACGCDVWEAASAPAAIEVLEAHSIDVVFSDIHMPGHINGLGLARWVLAHQPNVKVVLTSAAFSASELPADLSSSVRMVDKPYDLSTVLRQIRMCWERSGGMREAAIEPTQHLAPYHVRAGS